jgi:hypothetical protein
VGGGKISASQSRGTGTVGGSHLGSPVLGGNLQTLKWLGIETSLNWSLSSILQKYLSLEF